MYSLIQQTFSEHLPCAVQYLRVKDKTVYKTDKNPCHHKANTLVIMFP